MRTRMVMARDLGIAPTEQAPAIAIASGENLRWGSVWGGFFVALFISSILMVIPAGAGVSPTALVTNTWWFVWEIFAVVAGTFLGSLLAGFQSGVYNKACAGLNGLVLGAFVVGIVALTGLGYFTLSLGLHRAFIAALPINSAGYAWAYFSSACVTVLAGLGGGLLGEAMRERNVMPRTGSGQ
ncbi:MAG: hypothetical protein KGR26_07845 [Cyanobacteria bacterium REEB65]|nr:hypothetical protein [Cyanobacteria bacterium REEB65]